MTKILIQGLTILLIFSSAALSQTDGKNKLSDELSKESSNFVGQPDPLDPLPQKQESLKEDEEPVLEDIKQVLDKPIKKAPKEKKAVVEALPPAAESNAAAEPPPPEIQPSEPVPAVDPAPEQVATPVEAPAEPPVKKVKKIIRKKIVKSENADNAVSAQATSNPDDPDLTLERRLYRYRVGITGDVAETTDQEWMKFYDLSQVKEYEIQPGNNLESISLLFFGDRKYWPKIWSLNNPKILNPHFIYPGAVIRFFPGTVDTLPAAIIDSPQASEDSELVQENQIAGSQMTDYKRGTNINDLIFKDTMPTFGQSPDGRSYKRQNTEIEKLSLSKNNAMMDKPQPLPQTFKMHVDYTYFNRIKKLADMKVDKQLIQRPKIIIPRNLYYLSSESLAGDYKIKSESSTETKCFENQYIGKVTKLNSEAAAGRYAIVEKFEPVISSYFKSTYIYKIVGHANIYDDLSMRISNCNSLINSDAVLVKESRLQQLKEPTEKYEGELRIVGGLEFSKQAVFNTAQFVVLSQGADGSSAGQDLDVYSNLVGGVVARLKVVQNVGSLSIGYITAVKNVVNLGDKVIAKSDADEDLVNDDFQTE